MVRKVFFSFHYDKDVWRANQVRNSWITKPDREAAGYIDKAEFEEVKKKGEKYVKAWIDKQIEGTSVTVVLIGAETSNRPYCQYELKKSYEKDNAIIGIYIHKLKNQDGNTSSKGNTYFGKIGENDGKDVYFSNGFRIYDWIDDKGYDNLGTWIEQAAKEVGR